MSHADGVFGPQTFHATVAFQKRNGLNPDGAVGPKTLAKAKENGFAESKTPHVASPAAVATNPQLPTPNGLLYDLKDHSISIPATMQPVVARIAFDYNRITGKRLVVTSGSRTPEEQASAMRNNLDNGIDAGYADKAAYSEIVAAYKSAQPNATARNEAMAKVIRTQISKGTYISSHLHDGALDFRVPKGADKKTLVEIIDKRGDVWRNPKETTHVHVQLNRAR